VRFEVHSACLRRSRASLRQEARRPARRGIGASGTSGRLDWIDVDALLPPQRRRPVAGDPGL